MFLYKTYFNILNEYIIPVRLNSTVKKIPRWGREFGKGIQIYKTKWFYQSLHGKKEAGKDVECVPHSWTDHIFLSK